MQNKKVEMVNNFRSQLKSNLLFQMSYTLKILQRTMLGASRFFPERIFQSSLMN
jgi:hypothetical protein